MKPIPILLSINLALFAVWGLVFTVVLDRPEYIPLFLSLQTAMNVLGAGIFLLDKRKAIMVAFLVGAGISLAAAVGGYVVMEKYKHLIFEQEGFNT